MTASKNCYFCTNNIKTIEHTDLEALRRFLDPQAKILLARKTNTCPKHQRKISRAIKRARILGLLPFVSR